MLSIPVRVTSESELYEQFDPDKRMLSGDLRDYLEQFIEDREIGQEVRIVLSGNEPIDVARFQDAYAGHVDKLMRRCATKRKKRAANAVRLLGIGIAFVVAGLLLAGAIGPVLAAIISTIGSFSIWEAAAIWLEDIPSLRKSERVLGVYRRATIELEGDADE